MKRGTYILHFVCINLLFIGLVPLAMAAVPETDSLQSVLANRVAEGNLLEQVVLHRAIADIYNEEEEDYKLALEHLNKAMAIAEQVGNAEAITVTLLSLGNLHERYNQYEEALKYGFRLRDLDETQISKDRKSEALSMIAKIYQELGDYTHAYDFQLQALEIREESRDSNGIATSLYRLGSIFFYQDNFEMALEHYHKALRLSQKIGYTRMEYSSNCAIGAVHENLGDADRSLEYLQIALRLAKNQKYDIGVFYALLNIGCAYMGMEAYDKGEDYLQEALSMSQSLGDKWGEVGALSNLGQVMMEQGKPKEAIEFFKSALDVATLIGSKVRMVEIYGLLAEANATIDNHAKAYEYLKQETVLRDSILSEKTVREMGTRKTRYEVQKRETEIALLKKEKQIANLNGYMLVGTAIFLLLLSGLLFSRIQVQKKSHRLLEEKNKKIFLQKEKLEAANERQKETNKLLEEKNQQIHVQNKKLEESNDDLKQFAYVASHDLKEPLRMISSYTTLLGKRYNHLFDDTANEFFLYVTDGVKRMETMLTDLLSYSRVNSQQKPAQPVKTGDIMEIVAATLRAKVEEAGGEIRFDPARLPVILSNRTHMTQLFQNLVSNALKFMGDKKPCVTVDCVPVGDVYQFSVNDNGIGISPENIEKIFEMFRRLHTRDEYEGTGIGLATCKKIVERHGGKIWVESEVGVGSTFFFSIPNPDAVSATSSKATQEPAMA
ncbi:MAG: tetratricopeptide repeat protein [Bacteroidota bacterium]